LRSVPLTLEVAMDGQKLSTLSHQLAEVLKQDTRPLVIIVTQMDPDAMGSALGLKNHIKNLRPEATIYYCGYISHKQNQTIMNLLDLGHIFLPIAEMPQTSEFLDSHLFAFVDSSSVDDSRLGQLRGKIIPRIVIDHHHGDFRPKDGDFNWVEHHVGAASTLLTELWQYEVHGTGKEASPVNPKLSPDVAKLLCLGIYSDTHNLIAATDRDLAAWIWLRGFINEDDLKPFMRYPLSTSLFEQRILAWKRRVVKGSILVTNCGYMESQDGDNLSTIADELIRLPEFSQVYVWGIVGNKVRVSVRTDDVALALSEHLRRIFGPASGAKVGKDGVGEGGASIALELDHWSMPEAEREKLAFIKKSLEAKIFRASRG